MTSLTPCRRYRSDRHVASGKTTVPYHKQSATVPVTELKLGTLKTRRTVTKATMMYKIIGDPVDVSPACSTLTPTQISTRGLQMKRLVPHSRTQAHKHSFFPAVVKLWNSIPPHTPSMQNEPKPSKPFWKTGQGQPSSTHPAAIPQDYSLCSFTHNVFCLFACLLVCYFVCFHG